MSKNRGIAKVIVDGEMIEDRGKPFDRPKEGRAIRMKVKA